MLGLILHGLGRARGAVTYPTPPTVTTPSWIAAGTADKTGTSSSAPAYGTNSTGDLFVMVVAGRLTSVTAPAGWTRRAGFNEKNGRRVYVFTRDTRSTGGESGTVSVTLAANAQISTIHTFRNVSTSNFIEAFASGGSTSNGSTLSGLSVATTGANRLAVLIWANGDPLASGGAITGMTGGTWVERNFNSTSVGSNSTYALQTADLSSGGTISGGSVTITGINEHSSIGFALVSDGLSPSWFPGSLAEILGWYAGDFGVSQSAGSVTAWADQSSDGANLVSLGSNPSFSATGWNSAKPAITFTGYLINQTAGLGTWVQGTNVPYTLFATVKFVASGFSTLCEWSDNAITTICSNRVDNTGKPNVDKFTLGTALGSTNIAGANHRVCILSNASGAVSYFVDGTTEINAVSLSGALTTIQRLIVGNSWTAGNPVGTIAELIICAGDQSAQFSNYRTYSASKWGG